MLNFQGKNAAYLKRGLWILLTLFISKVSGFWIIFKYLERYELL